jgi:hypothetical protein
MRRILEAKLVSVFARMITRFDESFPTPHLHRTLSLSPAKVVVSGENASPSTDKATPFSEHAKVELEDVGRWMCDAA